MRAVETTPFFVIRFLMKGSDEDRDEDACPRNAYYSGLPRLFMRQCPRFKAFFSAQYLVRGPACASPLATRLDIAVGEVGKLSIWVVAAFHQNRLPKCA
jgi:hypothetical protein